MSKKKLTVTEELVIEHCQQIIDFAEETMDAISDKEKQKALATK